MPDVSWPVPRFLIVRHPRFRRFFVEVLPRWLQANFPSLAPYFELRDLPVRIEDWTPYAAHAAWLQDPVQRWSLKTYNRALALAEECDARGIPVINRVDRLTNATKSRAARLLNEAGIQTARMALIEDRREFQDTLLGLRPPLFVREDWGHSRRVARVDTPDDVRRIRWGRFERPLAVELVDVRDPIDGLYRKYRYFALGNIGVSHHLQTSEGWITRGDHRVVTPQTRSRELEYVSRPDPNHESLQRSRRALGLDVAAFDYGYTPDGRMIVWEANPLPHITFSIGRLKYRNAAIHRTMLAMVHLYFSTARLPIPGEIADALALDWDALQSRLQIPSKPTLADRLRAWRSYLPRKAG